MKDAQSFFEGEPDGNVKLRLSVDDINAKLIESRSKIFIQWWMWLAGMKRNLVYLQH